MRASLVHFLLSLRDASTNVTDHLEPPSIERNHART